jgi:hypothetical protein
LSGVVRPTGGAGRWLRIVAFAAGVGVLLGCAPRGGPGEPVAPGPPEGEQSTVIKPPPQNTIVSANGEGLVLPSEALISQALADASGRTGLPLAALSVVESSPRTWRDGSLGCPEPGMNYTQALVPGWRLVIRAGEELLDYRMATRGTAFMYCPPDRARDPGLTNER